MGDGQLSVLATDQLRPCPNDGLKGVWEPDESVCIEIVELIQANDQRGVERLYHHCSREITVLLYHLLDREDVEDRLHDVLMAVVFGIQKGQLREPARLHGYIRTITRRFAIATLKERITRRRREVDNATIDNIASSPQNAREHTAEQDCIRKQGVEIAHEVLRAMSQRYRDILYRFYVLEEDPEEIQREMNLTPTQFRLAKSRAKERFGALGRARLEGHRKAMRKSQLLRSGEGFATSTFPVAWRV